MPYQQGVAQRDAASFPPKACDTHQKYTSSTRNQWAVEYRTPGRVGPSSDGLHAARKAQHDRGEFAFQPVRGNNALQPRSQERRPVQPQIHQYDSAKSTPNEQRSGGIGSGLHFTGGIAGVRVRLIQQQSEGSDYRSGRPRRISARERKFRTSRRPAASLAGRRMGRMGSPRAPAGEWRKNPAKVIG